MKIKIEIDLDGLVEVIIIRGYENRKVSISEIGEIIGLDELVRVKMMILQMNSEMRIK